MTEIFHTGLGLGGVFVIYVFIHPVFYEEVLVSENVISQDR